MIRFVARCCVWLFIFWFNHLRNRWFWQWKGWSLPFRCLSGRTRGRLAGGLLCLLHCRDSCIKNCRICSLSFLVSPQILSIWLLHHHGRHHRSSHVPNRIILYILLHRERMLQTWILYYLYVLSGSPAESASIAWLYNLFHPLSLVPECSSGCRSSWISLFSHISQTSCWCFLYAWKFWVYYMAFQPRCCSIRNHRLQNFFVLLHDGTQYLKQWNQQRAV